MQSPRLPRDPFAEPSSAPDADADGAIRATDTDAALARLSAVRRGYLTDAFLPALVPRARTQPARPPLINVGTHARAWAMDALVDRFFACAARAASGTQAQVQVVSLGAGSDTRFWRLATGPHSAALACYVELDFPENTSKKAMAIRKSRELSSVLGAPETISVENGGTTLHAARYHLLPTDLRRPPAEALAALAAPRPGGEPLLSRTLPTLLLAECVLVYMPPAASAGIVRWFADHAAPGAVLGAVVYEMFGLQDAFGRVMLRNLLARQVALPGAEAFPDLAALRARFTGLGFDIAGAVTLHDVRARCIPPAELSRIAKLEMLDELEELQLVLAHYAITWALQFPHERGAPGPGSQSQSNIQGGADTDAASASRGVWETWGLDGTLPAASVVARTSGTDDA